VKLRGALIVTLVTLAACAAPAKPRYYTLSSESTALAKAAGEVSEYRVAVGPVSVPEALDRPQIVLRVAPNRYAISDPEHWSEPLKSAIPRVIADEIGQRLPAARVAAHRQHGGQAADYRVLIDVLRFESVPGESITLEAAWSVLSRGGERLREARSVFVEPVDAPGVAPLVAAHGKALAVLSREIADVVDALARAKR